MSDRHDDIGRLGAALERIPPPFDEDEAVSIALEGARGSRASGGGSRWTRASGRLRFGVRAVSGAIGAAAARCGDVRPRWRFALVGSAAAVVAVLALPSPDPAEPNPARLVAPGTSEPAGADGFSVQAPEDGGMAVFETSNPRIRVVWFYDEAGSGD